MTTSMTMTARDQQEVDQANASGLAPIVFVHGLWLLSNSWDRWRGLFEEHGYATLAPGWPDDPETVEEAYHDPEVFADKSIKQATDHYAAVIAPLTRKPAIIGHSFGGLIVQRLAAAGLAAATVAISPAPFRGVLPLPFAALKSATPVLGNPANYHRAVPLSFEQFRYGFANVVDEDEAHALYETYSVPAPGKPIFQSATANLNPWTDDTVDTANPRRGPLLIITSPQDHTVPPAIAAAAYERQRKNPGVTEFKELPDRGAR